ncbi:MAG: MMPL family transporter, partial [Bacillaceae bacterium]
MSMEVPTPAQRLFKWKIVILLIWTIALIALFVFTTPLSTVIDKKGSVSLPNTTLTSTATDIQRNHSMNTSDIKSFAIVFSSANPLTDSEKDEISQITKSINEEKESLNITSINSPTETPDLKDQLEAKDGKSIFLSGSANMDNQSAATLKQNLEKKLENTSLHTYITGKMFIDDISNKQTEQGVKKGLIIALVLFVIASLILVRKVMPIVLTLVMSVISFIATTS